MFILMSSLWLNFGRKTPFTYWKGSWVSCKILLDTRRRQQGGKFTYNTTLRRVRPNCCCRKAININPLTPNDPYMGRTAPLTSRGRTAQLTSRDRTAQLTSRGRTAPLTSRGRTAQLTSRCCILYIYSTNIPTEHFKHAAHTPFFLFKMPFIS